MMGAQGTPVENLGANTLTYTASDGTVVVFQRLVVDYYYEEGRVISVTRPNGETLTYRYYNYPGYGDPSTYVEGWVTPNKVFVPNNYFYPSAIISMSSGRELISRSSGSRAHKTAIRSISSRITTAASSAMPKVATSPEATKLVCSSNSKMEVCR